jgi:hypothetical protein
MVRAINIGRIQLIKDLIRFSNNQTKNKINLQLLHKISIITLVKINIMLQTIL